MFVDRSFCHHGPVVNISLRNKNGILKTFNYDPDMIMLPIFKYAIVKDDVARFRSKVFSFFMILNPGITHRKFFPGDASCKMTAFAFTRTDRDIETRFHAAIIHKCRAPQPVRLFNSPPRKVRNDRFQIRCFPFFKTMEWNLRHGLCDTRQLFFGPRGRG